MRTVVSAKEMRWCDDTTIRTYGVPGLLLMENAGRGVAEIALKQLGPLTGTHVVVVCGKGNNGGDGFVVARHLVNLGAIVTVLLLASSRILEGDAKTNYQILDRLRHAYPHSLVIKSFSPAIIKKLSQPRLIVDAIFGTGFRGTVPQSVAGAIEWINKLGVPVLSVDIPSGVDGTTGSVANSAVKATVTATFGLQKTGLLCNQGQDLVGSVIDVEIGIPKAVSRSKSLKTFVVESADVRTTLPRRSSTAHKYSVGKVLVLAGSKGYTGAAYLCALAALRAGAGAVMLGTPEAVYPILGRRLSEVIVKPLPSTAEGSIAEAALPEINEKMKWADVIAIGPGLSTNPETQRVIRSIIINFTGNIVVDADALRAVGEIGFAKLSRLKGSFVLTPHSGEFSRLAGVPTPEVEVNRIEMARSGAVKSKAVVVLKGGPTVTGSREGRVYLNSTGNPGMASVGSGDVLTGIIASLWAQGMTDAEAARSGVYLHGLAGDIAKELYGERSVIAQDLIDRLPAAIMKVEGT